MIITKETDYALRVLRALEPGKRMHTSQIAREHQIPYPYCQKIVQRLGGCGYISNSRGRNGGIELSCDLSSVTLLDLVKLMENAPSLCACGLPDYECTWRHNHGECHVHNALCALQQDLYDSMANVYLRDLLYDQSRKEKADALSDKPGT